MLSAFQRMSPVLGRILARPASMMGRRTAVRPSSCLATTRPQHLPASTAGCSDPSTMSLVAAADDVPSRQIVNFLPSAQFVASPQASLSASVATILDDVMASLLGPSILLIKRTFQPSILRKKRKHGFLKRHKSVGGRRVLNRRKHKGRARLGAG